MNDFTDRSTVSKVLLALVVIAVGVLMLVNNFYWHRHIGIGDLWPLLLVLFGVSLLGQARKPWQFVDGGALIVLGLLIFESHVHLIPSIHFRFWSLWPLILVYIGLRILFWQPWHIPHSEVDKDSFDIAAIFGGGEYKFQGRTLKGGAVRAVFGGCNLDFRDAEMAGDSIVINCFAAFGGIDIRVPMNWGVTVKGVPILGGIDNKASGKPVANGMPAKTLILEATVILGGIEVKN